jgi:hypothetical protein
VFEIGNSLREARLRQGLDFPELEQATKIRGKYLRALEEEQFEVLPAQTYVKGFLRSYADYLGLEGQLYVDEFNSRYVRGEIEEDPPLKARPSAAWPRRSGSFQGKVVLLTLALIVGLAMFFFAAFKWGGNDEQAVYPLKNPGRQSRAKAPARPLAHLVASAATGNCYLAVYRRQSRRGKAIFEGTLERGSRSTFVGRRLWVFVIAPANLRLRLNGKPVVVPGRGQGPRRWLEVTPTRVAVAPPVA